MTTIEIVNLALLIITVVFTSINIIIEYLKYRANKGKDEMDIQLKQADIGIKLLKNLGVFSMTQDLDWTNTEEFKERYRDIMKAGKEYNKPDFIKDEDGN